MMELPQHTFAKPKKSVPWDALMYETALFVFVYLSQSTMCGGVASHIPKLASLSS